MRSTWAVLSVCAAFAVAGCASDDRTRTVEPVAVVAPAAVAPAAWAGITEAIAVVQPTKGNKAHGTVRFSETPEGVHVVATIEGLKPDAKHAFHIHEFGDPSSGDGKSAGGHYNPEGNPHGGPDAEKHHAGDLGNLVADGKGNAHLDRVIAGLTIAGDHDPIVGRSVIIHAGEDDFATQPTGNAGDRIACGVIGIAKSVASPAK